MKIKFPFVIRIVLVILFVNTLWSYGTDHEGDNIILTEVVLHQLGNFDPIILPSTNIENKNNVLHLSTHKNSILVIIDTAVINDKLVSQIKTTYFNEDKTVDYKIALSHKNKNLPNSAFDPQISPTGDYVMFKFGDQSSSNGQFKLFALNVKSNQISQITNKLLSYRSTSWSPDSKYVAFVQGGDYEGGVFDATRYIGPLSLYVSQWKSGRDGLVGKSNFIRGPFTWRSSHSLIYSKLTEKEESLFLNHIGNIYINNYSNKKKPTAIKSIDLKVTPLVFQYVPESQLSQLLTDGFKPIVSNEGDKIAFWGSENSKIPYPLRLGWQDNPQGRALTVSKIDGSSRTPINREAARYSQLIWITGGKSFLTLSELSGSPEARMIVKEWDVRTLKSRYLATLVERDYTELPRSIVDPQFNIRQIYEAENLLIVESYKFIGIDPSDQSLMPESSIKSISLKDGSEKVLINIKGSKEVDFLILP